MRILYIAVFLYAIVLPLASVFASDGPLSVRESTIDARLQYIEDEAEEKADEINRYYNTGKNCYYRCDYLAAIANFQELLKIYPEYKPAKLYLQCAVIQHKIDLQQNKINSLKLKMADIVADYDRRVHEGEGLAFNYLLEQALLRCQAGNFEEAEHYYNLCYKLDPNSKEKITWFVNATYELKDLYDSLNESYDKIEELSKTESE